MVVPTFTSGRLLLRNLALVWSGQAESAATAQDLEGVSHAAKVCRRGLLILSKHIRLDHASRCVVAPQMSKDEGVLDTRQPAQVLHDQARQSL